MARFTKLVIVLLLINIAVTYLVLLTRNASTGPDRFNIDTDTVIRNNYEETTMQSQDQTASNHRDPYGENHHNSNNTYLHSEDNVNVLVLASMRTGSSFVGEIFKQNKEFLYIFEPLRGLNLKDDDPMLPVLGLEMMNDMYNCNFSTPATNAFLDKLYNARVPLGKRDVVSAWVNKKYCTGWSQKFQFFNRCLNLNSDTAEESCTSFKYKAIKIIRLHDLNSFVYLVRDPKVNLKIINVLRDPRAMMASVIPIAIHNYKAFTKEKTNFVLKKDQLSPESLQRLKTYCAMGMRNYLLGTKGKRVLGNSYFHVRYEDMASDPEKIALQIYEFLGIEFPQRVSEWIQENTNEDMTEHALYAFKTKRNSKETSQKWRHRLNYDLVEEIENTGECARFMEVMGYRKAESQHMLSNMSIPFVL
ncbi:carbohydrate sulfotransferase 1-like [Saccoglossus kowalevskii]